MTITKFSRNRVMLSASRWTVPQEYFDPLFNYLVHGYSPGSFWVAVLANDFAQAVQSSHPSNDMAALKHAVGWMRDAFPLEAYGSYLTVDAWTDLSVLERRMILEAHDLVYSEQEEIMMALQGKTAQKPQMY